MKRTLFISVSIACLFSCSIEKTVCNNKEVSQATPETLTTSSRYDSQHELAVMMRSWTQEQRDEFRQKYVYSEVNFTMKNGDTLTVK